VFSKYCQTERRGTAVEKKHNHINDFGAYNCFRHGVYGNGGSPGPHHGKSWPAKHILLNVRISDVGPLTNWDSWQLFLILSGPGLGAKFVNFRSVVTNSDYVFYGDSANYIDLVSPLGNIAAAYDDTISGNGVTAEVDDLLAQVTVDVGNAKPGETYTISLPASTNLFHDAAGNVENLAQLQPDYTFQVVPVPASAWLLSGGLIGLLGLRRKFKS